MKQTIEAGLKYTHRYVVPKEKTVPHVYAESEMFQEMPEVFATAFMVGLMEWACMEALKPHLEEGEITLGTNISVSHLAATPPGMEVVINVTCTNVDGPRTSWAIEARDEKDLISEGTHERFTIRAEKFEKIVEGKKG